MSGYARCLVRPRRIEWHRRMSLLGLATSVSCLGFAVAQAQTADVRILEEVIVSAQKQAERIQDVPVPVTVLNTENLATNNQVRLQDYYTQIPGLTWSTKDVGEPILAIRGLLTGGYTNPTVGIVIDEVPYGPSVVQGSSPSVPDIDPNDLARIEVLRGPQGTLYGASSLGGLVKFVTVEPSTEAVTGRVQLGTTSVNDSDDIGYNVRGAVNVPLSDTAAFSVSGFTLRDPGYVDNVQTGEDDINERDSEGGRVAFVWHPSDAFSLKLGALLQNTETKGPAEVDTALGHEPQQNVLPGAGGHTRDVQAYSVTMSGKVGAVEWISATGYSIDDADNTVDATAIGGGFFSGLAQGLFGVAGAAIVGDVETEKFTQEVRLTVPLGSKVQWLIGAFYGDEDLDANVIDSARDPVTGAEAGRIITFKTPTSFTERAAFTNLTFDVTDRFDVQVGGRVFENEESSVSMRTGPQALVWFGSDPSVDAGVSSKDSSSTYLLTPRFKISPDWMAYARLASGYRPGGANTTCLPPFPCGYKADRTKNYELGLKGTAFGNTVSFDLSAYYIDWQDLQLTQYSPTFFAYIDNASEARSEGVEVAVDSRPLDGLTVSAWLAWNNAELTEDLPHGQAVGSAGDRLPYSSRISGALSFQQAFPVGASATGFIGSSLSYVGDREGAFQGLFASPGRDQLPSYTQLDLRGGVTFDSWTVHAFVNNITDERGLLKAGRDSNSPTYVTYIQPRTIGVSLIKSF
jgi:iron complex outermembrane recepter protein